MTYNLPTTYEDWYAKGTFDDKNGLEVYFEMPAVFNEDNTVNAAATVDKINTFIENYNLMVSTNGN